MSKAELQHGHPFNSAFSLNDKVTCMSQTLGQYCSVQIRDSRLLGAEKKNFF